jgi:hypothetical protein
MKITKQQLEKIIKEEMESVMAEEFGDDEAFRMRDMIPPKVRGKFKDTFTKIPNPDLEKRDLPRRRPDAREKAAWKAAGGVLSVFDKPTIAQFLEDAGLDIGLEKYMDNIAYAIKGDRLGRRINYLVDALALANPTGSRRGHLKDPRGRKGGTTAPEFTRESIEQMVKEEMAEALGDKASRRLASAGIAMEPEQVRKELMRMILGLDTGDEEDAEALSVMAAYLKDASSANVRQGLRLQEGSEIVEQYDQDLTAEQQTVMKLIDQLEEALYDMGSSNPEMTDGYVSLFRALKEAGVRLERIVMLA